MKKMTMQSGFSMKVDAGKTEVKKRFTVAYAASVGMHQIREISGLGARKIPLSAQENRAHLS